MSVTTIGASREGRKKRFFEKEEIIGEEHINTMGEAR